MVLKQEEIDACREAFLAFDKDRSGTIDVWELRQVLEELGQAPTEDELFQVRGQREIWGDIGKREKRERASFFFPSLSTHARTRAARKYTHIPSTTTTTSPLPNSLQMISEVDENMSGSIDFGEFIKVVEAQKARAENVDDEDDMIDAFLACGGSGDGSGHVRRDTLVKIIKTDFGLTIDIEELINKIDTDGSGQIEFEEFKILLSS